MLDDRTAAAVGTLLAAAKRVSDEPLTSDWSSRTSRALKAVLRGDEPPTRHALLAGLIETIALLTAELAWTESQTVDAELTVMLNEESWTDTNVLMARDYLATAIKAARAGDVDGVLDQVAVLDETPALFSWGIIVAMAIGGELVTRCRNVNGALPSWVQAALEDGRG
jgi:hypothetical protein